jgi:hypothetical protein
MSSPARKKSSKKKSASPRRRSTSRSPRSPRSPREEKKKKVEPECPVCESRKLWLEHVFWTREVAALTLFHADKAAAPDLKRLYTNQEDLGNWFAKAVNDSDTGKAVTSLLQIHIAQAVKIVSNIANDGGQEELKGLQEDWKENAMTIANALADIGKKHHFKWPKKTLQKMMADHLKLTTDEVLKFKAEDYEGAVAAFEEVEAEIITMSDALVSGMKLKCECSA